MILRKGIVTLMVAILLSTLSACDSAKERAQKHLESGLALLEAGDADRALVEFRNVFKLDATNREARMAFASVMEDRGNLREAFAQYNRVIEQYPADLDAIKAAARVAGDMGDWKEAKTQVTAGLALAPGDLDLLAVQAGVDYAAASSTSDAAAQAKAAATALDLINKLPDNQLVRRLVIDNLMRNQDIAAATLQIDAAIQKFPDQKEFYVLRLMVLGAQKDNAGIEAQLKQLTELFPQDQEFGATLLRWYVSQGDLDKAEAYLRDSVAKDPSNPETEMALIGFLSTYRDPQAALAEVDRAIAATPASLPEETATDPATPVKTSPLTVLRSLRASILFDQGKREEGIKEMQAITAGAPPSEDLNKVEVALAHMQLAVGDAVSARALIEKVLTQDSGQLEAIKLKASWLIEDDATDDAIALLRKALGDHPDDPQIMTLLAQAYQRSGNHDLIGDMLAQAVEASNKAPEESVRYASFLAADQNYLPAESVLIDALRLAPNNVSILGPLGQLYIAMKDWPRATAVADNLDQIGTPDAIEAGQVLRPAILQGEKKTDEAVSYLQGLTQDGTGDYSAQIAIIRTYMGNGQTDKAQAVIDDLLAKNPNDPTLLFVAATMKSATGDMAGAEAGYRALLAQDPKRLPVWMALIRQLAASGNTEAAQAALDEALVVLPDAGDLQVVQAGFLEKAGNIDAAIAIYDKLYRADSSNQILANNLASLLASYHSNDAASLDRAYAVARRLSGTDVAPFQDTYGWIVFLRGNPAEALGYLEPAAKELAQDPLVQFHLAEVYRALNKPEEARAAYERVLALIPEGDTQSFVQTARDGAAGKLPFGATTGN